MIYIREFTFLSGIQVFRCICTCIIAHFSYVFSSHPMFKCVLFFQAIIRFDWRRFLCIVQRSSSSFGLWCTCNIQVLMFEVLTWKLCCLCTDIYTYFQPVLSFSVPFHAIWRIISYICLLRSVSAYNIIQFLQLTVFHEIPSIAQ